jgi:hypothetical protein
MYEPNLILGKIGISIQAGSYLNHSSGKKVRLVLIIAVTKKKEGFITMTPRINPIKRIDVIPPK